MPRPSSDRRAIKDRARSALLLLAPSPRSVGRNRPATKFLLSELPPLTFARRDPAKSGLDFLALLASLRGHADCCDRHRGDAGQRRARRRLARRARVFALAAVVPGDAVLFRPRRQIDRSYGQGCRNPS
jgi:hypothetical protein